MKVTFRKQIARGNKQFKQGETYVISDDVAKDYIARGFCYPIDNVKNEIKTERPVRQTKEHKEAVEVASVQAEKAEEAPKKPAAKRGRPKKSK